MRVPPRYVVSVWQWSREDHCYTRTAQYAGYGSLASARTRADTEARLLPVVETTWALRFYARSGFVTVSVERYKRYDGRTHYRAPGFPLAPLTVYTAFATERYVPSIGERGF